MPSSDIAKLLGESTAARPPKASPKSPVKSLLEGVVNIHIHNGQPEPPISAEPVPEAADELRPGPASGPKNYSFRVVRDTEGRITEILATRLS
jgi:hypothetical protein